MFIPGTRLTTDVAIPEMLFTAPSANVLKPAEAIEIIVRTTSIKAWII